MELLEGCDGVVLEYHGLPETVYGDAWEPRSVAVEQPVVPRVPLGVPIAFLVSMVCLSNVALPFSFCAAVEQAVGPTRVGPTTPEAIIERAGTRAVLCNVHS